MNAQPTVSSDARATETYREVVRRLGSAQKPAARSAPAYSRFVNRRLGRYLAAWAYRAGLTPNAVTGLSALATFTGIALLAVLAPGPLLGVLVTLCLVLGYALDSADGQVARLTGRGSAAGEWLDHVVDATKIACLPLALLVGLYRAGTVETAWLVVPLVHAVAGSVLFFAMILTEQMRRARGTASVADTGGRLPWLRSLLAVPTDYGVLCLSFLLLVVPAWFFVAYTAIVIFTVLFVAAACVKWFRELNAPVADLGERDI
ncbi:CDP-alcohol phosphatidyltransferase family protein [Cellulomonas edaphi]|uniref:CDP-alcohol phosphatidyltransferase family protein n=1 Tax=Cellulomonas edaphi TaxID=3053468 RepID=A0ABT7S4Y0_9CELL|nr:CDP-alcohol phosphatidyltransferase family protein [Cellulomons edaphi]MDM7830684.1 CDP-alcohol phosphatidyltransferase family protein [Cellulomons edaphi]